MIGVTALAADTEDEARFQARAGALSMVLLRSGRLQEIPTPEQAAAYPYSPAELDLIGAMAQHRGGRHRGDRWPMAWTSWWTGSGCTEMLISTRAHGAAAKLRSMELIAGAYALRGRVAN